MGGSIGALPRRRRKREDAVAKRANRGVEGISAAYPASRPGTRNATLGGIEGNISPCSTNGGRNGGEGDGAAWIDAYLQGIRGGALPGTRGKGECTHTCAPYIGIEDIAAAYPCSCPSTSDVVGLFVIQENVATVLAKWIDGVEEGRSSSQNFDLNGI